MLFGTLFETFEKIYDYRYIGYDCYKKDIANIHAINVDFRIVMIVIKTSNFEYNTQIINLLINQLSVTIQQILQQ